MFKTTMIDQPLDFSTKSPSSPGLDNYHSSNSSSKSRQSSGSSVKDDVYWQRREKNNAAAKRSRDARRQKEEQTKLENQLLRQENENLRKGLNTIKAHYQTCPYINMNAGKGADEHNTH